MLLTLKLSFPVNLEVPDSSHYYNLFYMNMKTRLGGLRDAELRIGELSIGRVGFILVSMWVRLQVRVLF